MADTKLELDPQYVYSAQGDPIRNAPKYPTLIPDSPWILCDWAEEVEGQWFIYPVDSNQVDAEGTLFETSTEKYPVKLQPGQISKLQRWLPRVGVGFAFAFYNGSPLIEHQRIPELYRREIFAVDGTTKNVR